MEKHFTHDTWLVSISNIMLESTRREMHGMVAGILEEQLCGCTEDYAQLIKR